MDVERQPLVIRDDQPLMELCRYDLQYDDFNFGPAYTELANYAHQRGGESHTWGYFPELNPNPSEYPETVRLAEQLESKFLATNPSLAASNYQLAFIRAATGEPASDYQGLHVDVHPGIAHQRDSSREHSLEVKRLLINPSTVARKLGYVALTAPELRSAGVNVPKDHYQTLEIPNGIAVSSVEIPPAEKHAMYGLEFYSSLLPHMGITNKLGHYLIAFGAYSSPNQASSQ